jgi:hypothetical protein
MPKKVLDGKIYLLKDPRDGSIRYVGKCESTLEIRLSNHKSEASHSKKKNHRLDWIRCLQKNNLQPQIELVQDGFSTSEELCIAEIFLIQFCKDIGLSLVNGSLGGEGGKPFLGKKHSSEWKRNQSLRKIGENNHNFGKQFSEEHKLKISQSMKGKKKSTTFNMKKPKSEEHKNSMKGRIPWNKGLIKDTDSRVASNYANRGL